MSTTLLPVELTKRVDVGPGPSDTNRTVTATVRRLNATMGTSATSNVRIRLFTAQCRGCGRSGLDHDLPGEICVRAVKSV